MPLLSPTTSDASRPRERVPAGLWAASIVLMGLAAPFLLWAGTLYYADLVDTPTRPGELYLGDGTGFILGTIGGLPGLLLLTAGVSAPVLWRRGRAELSLGLVLVATCIGALAVIGVVALWTSG